MNMKNLKFVALLTMFVFGSVLTFAQDIAHIDFNKVYDAMPEYKKANDDYEALGKKHQGEIEKIEASYKALMDQAQKDLQGKSQEEVQKIIVEKKYQEQEQAIQQKLQSYREAAQKEMMEKEKSMFEPIYNKVKVAIDSVAKRKNIKYVLPENMVIYSGGGYDLFNDVKAELKLK